MSTLPPDLRQALVEQFGTLAETRSVGGGDTSAAAEVVLAGGKRLFVKWGTGHAGDSYAPEADGLQALAAAAPATVLVPRVLARAEPIGNDVGYLVLPWLVSGRPSRDEWWRFGESLARLHGAPSPLEGYGWTRDNYLGRAPQPNTVVRDWPVFYADARLGAIREHVRRLGRWQRAWDERFDRLLASLPERLPRRPPPALVHGDLWGGNALALADGRFALVDPAVFVGHAEVDLAMTELFGGFPEAFYAGYGSVTPLEPGYEERRDVYQLYYLAMHLVVSASYASRVEAVLRQLTGNN